MLYFQVFTWRTTTDIDEFIIPFLDTVIDSEQLIVRTTTNATAKAESTNKLTQLNAAKKGWQSLLSRNEGLYESAQEGDLEHVTHLVAEALLQDSKYKDNVKFINGTNAPDANPLREISAIRCAHCVCVEQHLLALISYKCVASVGLEPRYRTQTHPSTQPRSWILGPQPPCMEPVSCST